MTRRPRLLDLYCGAGGASVGYARVGFDVVGVDIAPQPRYPFVFVQGDALRALSMLDEMGTFDVIHASPPCQPYSVTKFRVNKLAGKSDNRKIEATRDALNATGRPWIIENVMGAPLCATVKLCGSMFGLGANGRQLRRHRLFEANVALIQPECVHTSESIGVYGGGGVDRTGLHGRGGYQGNTRERREAMGISWMTGPELSEAIPPAYTAYLGAQLMRAVVNVDA